MSKMKYSGVEWIGNIPEKWNADKLKYCVTEINSGGTPESSNMDYYDDMNGIPWVAIGDMSTKKYVYNTSKKLTIAGIKSKSLKIYPFGTLLYSIFATIGKTAILKVDATINQAILAIIPNKKIDKIYLKYQLNAMEEYVLSECSTNTQNNLNSTKVKNFNLVIPSLKEQKLIADFLDEKVSILDEILSNLNKQVEILKNYKKSVITETFTKGLNKKNKLKNSNVKWLGEIPENWGIKRLRYFIDEIKVGPFGSSLSGDDIKNNGSYWIYNQRTVLDNNFKDTDSFVDCEKYKELKGFEVKPRDILLTTRGTIGKTAIVPDNCEKGILHPCLIKFKVNENLINANLLNIVFNNSDLILSQLNYKSNSTTIDVIYSYNLKDIYLPLIPLNEQKEIVEYLDNKCEQIDKIIEKKQKQIAKIEEYKKSVIYEYVTGKKRVEGAEELYG